jgi:hypothetical protein
MKILEKDIQTIKNFIKVAPIEVIKKLKVICDKNPDDDKIQEIMNDIEQRLGQ